MQYLGTFDITPNTQTITVECFGETIPAQKETLEQEPITAYNELYVVRHNGINITDYLCDNDISKLQDSLNKK